VTKATPGARGADLNTMLADEGLFMP